MSAVTKLTLVLEPLDAEASERVLRAIVSECGVDLGDAQVLGRRGLEPTDTRALLGEFRELCDAAQAVLEGKARHVDAAGDRYVLDATLRRLEAALAKVRRR